MRPLPFFGDRRGGFGSLVPGRERPALMVFLAWQWALPILFPTEPCCERINIVPPSGGGRIRRRSPRPRRPESLGRKSGAWGKSGSGLVDIVGRRELKKKKKKLT